MIDDLRASTTHGFLRPALLVVGCLFAVALLLAPFAIGKTGSAGIGGLATAFAICAACGLAAEAVAWLFAGKVAPLGIMLVGIAIRMVPPLAICLVLAATGARGSAHLAFIGYLLVMYLVMLALETWLTVKRVARGSNTFETNAR